MPKRKAPATPTKRGNSSSADSPRPVRKRQSPDRLEGEGYVTPTRRGRTTPTRKTTPLKKRGVGRPRKETTTKKAAPKRARTTRSIKKKHTEEEDEKEYEVESILSAEFLVKWKGFPKSQATLEPLDNLEGCHSLIEAFLKEHQAKHAALAAADTNASGDKEQSEEDEDKAGAEAE